METEHLRADVDGIARAAALLRDGAQVAFPTETVYGLGGDARNGRAVAGIFAAKGRPAFNPLIVHVVSEEAASEFGEVTGAAALLANAFWPGPLTLVVPLRPDAGLSPLVTAGLGTVGLRVPGGAAAQALLDEFGGPLAGPSANPSGRVSATSAAHVLAALGGMIAGVLDAGPCPVGVESTIVGVAPEPVLLRPGGVPVEEIEAVLGHGLARRGAGDGISAPGQLASHYAPRKPLRLNADGPREGELWLGFGHGASHEGLTLSATGDLSEAAANLFGHLHRLDAMPGAGIAVAPIPSAGLGAAINDRLLRAAAPRPG